MVQQEQENKMGVMPVGRLLFTMSLPMMISMLIQALYNVVDSIFVSQISENALSAVSLAFPFQNLMISVAVGTGVGVNALLSRSLGEGEYERANKTAENGVFLAVISCLVFTAVGLLCARPFFVVQTDIAEIVEHGTVYMAICGGACFGIFLEIIFERLLQSTGRTFYTMITQGIGAVINIVMDPVLIFGIGPFPELGVAGAAIATVLGQIVAAALAIFFNARFNPEIRLGLKGFRPSGAIIKRIYAVGLPSILLTSISSVMTFGMNKILLSFTSTAAAVFGVYFKLQSFVFMPIFGLNNGMVPIVSYNYGARKGDRLMKTVKLSILTAMGIMLLGLAVIQRFPGPILRLFNASEDMLSIGIPALRVISIHFILAGFSVVASSTFQALGSGLKSMTVSIVRQLVVLLPVAWLLSLSGNLSLVWWSFPIAELASVALCSLFLRQIYRKVVLPLSQPASMQQG
jgi:putative MATE family efflux protein